jgi:hypothetical protein
VWLIEKAKIVRMVIVEPANLFWSEGLLNVVLASAAERVSSRD